MQWLASSHPFLAYFKYAQYDNSAVILSVLLNLNRLTVSLDWYAYHTNSSVYSLTDYHQYIDLLYKNDFNI
nr:HI_0552 family protein [Alysiella sp.]